MLQGRSKLNGCDRDNTAWNDKYIYYLVFYGRSLLTPGLNCAPGGIQTKIASVGHVEWSKLSGYDSVEGAESSREDNLERSRDL